jgi:hypothetical protein
MGNYIYENFFQRKIKIILTGIEKVGKNTIKEKLKLGNLIKTISTIGFNCETFEYEKINLIKCDLCGKERLSFF